MREHWAIYNKLKHKYQFHIDEKTPQKAKQKLFKIIGYDSYKYRFICKKLITKEQFIKNDTPVPKELL